jgi:hypothetical protein
MYGMKHSILVATPSWGDVMFLLAHAPVDQLIDGTLHMGGRNTLSVPVASAYPLTDSRFTYK